MSGLKPRRRSSSLTTCRSAESSGSSVLSTTGGVGGGATSVGGGGAGAGTVVVSTLRSGGGVFGFLCGQPYITVNSTGTTIQAISFRFMRSPRFFVVLLFDLHNSIKFRVTAAAR